MMKVVINTCHGGWGVSREAFLRLRELGCQAALDEPDIGENWSDGSGPRKSSRYDSFGKRVLRADPLLVRVIEEMGSRASAPLAALKVVEIPDDVEWQIEEYDGREWVAEKHRIWE